MPHMSCNCCVSNSLRLLCPLLLWKLFFSFLCDNLLMQLYCFFEGGSYFFFVGFYVHKSVRLPFLGVFFLIGLSQHAQDRSGNSFCNIFL